MVQEIIEVLISGITSGSVYAVFAAGMALVYGVTKVFNFAYGSFYTFGGYIAWILFQLGFSYPLVLIVTISILFFSGLFIERLILLRMRKRDDWERSSCMVTLGLALLMDNTFIVIFGPFVKSIPQMLEGSVELLDFVFKRNDIAIFFIAILIMVFIMLFIDRTKLGMAVEAVAQDMTGAQMVGIRKDHIFAFVFAVSTVLVGVGGILLAPKHFVSPIGGWTVLIKAWVVTAFGGLGSIRGSLYAAYILGIVEAIIGWQFGLTWVLMGWFTVLLLTLIARPQGLLGKWG